MMRTVRAIPFTRLTDAELAKSLALELARLTDPDEDLNLRIGEPWPAFAEAQRRLARRTNDTGE